MRLDASRRLHAVWDMATERAHLNGYWLDLTGPHQLQSRRRHTDYRDNVNMNVIGQESFTYRAANTKLELPMVLNTNAWPSSRTTARSSR